MSVLEKLALGVGGLFMLLGVLRLARSPLKLVFRVAGNAALGFGALWLLGRTVPGLHLGLNVFNALADRRAGPAGLRPAAAFAVGALDLFKKWRGHFLNKGAAVCCGRQTLRGFCYIRGKSVVFSNILR